MNRHLELLGLSVIMTFGIGLLFLGLWLMIPVAPMPNIKEAIAGAILIFLGFLCITTSTNYSQSHSKEKSQ